MSDHHDGVLDSDSIDDDDDERPSKSQIKRDLLVHRQTAQQLVDLPESQLIDLPDPDILAAVRQTKGITKGNARKRLIQHIAKLIRKDEQNVIHDFLARFDSASHAHLLRTSTLERWRTGLIEEDQSAFDSIVKAHPDVNRQQLRALVRQAIAESPPADAYRRLFRFLRDL